MGYRNLDIFLALAGLCLFFTLFSDALEDCDCPGPTKYYQELGCVPMFRKPGACCPVRYDCSHWKDLPTDNCLVDGMKYEMDEPIGESARDPCLRYTCEGEWGVRTELRHCPIPDRRGWSESCFEKKTPFECCAKVLVCADRDEERATCIVDGKIYKEGESFWPAKGPSMHCICGAGYTGQNIAPFCKNLKPSYCENVIFRVKDIRANCIPVYDHDKSPQRSCNRGFRCQSYNDVVIPGLPPTESIEPEDPDMMCKFGNLTMRIGDVLGSRVTNVPCMGCICEVPPVPTCRACVPRV